MKVVLTHKARIDLVVIGDYIAQDSPKRAISFVRELAASARQIGEAPRGFAFLEGYESQGIRRKPYRTYSIFYRIIEDRIDVLHILHSAQDYGAFLQD